MKEKRYEKSVNTTKKKLTESDLPSSSSSYITVTLSLLYCIEVKQKTYKMT